MPEQVCARLERVRRAPAGGNDLSSGRRTEDDAGRAQTRPVHWAELGVSLGLERADLASGASALLGGDIPALLELRSRAADCATTLAHKRRVPALKLGPAPRRCGGLV